MDAATGSSSRTENKRAQYQTLIRRCFIQLTEGCGNKDCTNPHCATGSGHTMDHNQAAAKALTLVHKNKKFHSCIPLERACSSGVSSKTYFLNSVTPSASGASSLGDGSEDLEESFLDPSAPRSEPMETMETTDSLVTANTNTNKSASSGSAASSTLVRMQSNNSAVASNNNNSPTQQQQQHQSSQQPILNIPSDIEQVTTTSEGTEAASSSEILSTHSSGELLVNHVASASSISSSEIVGMDLSPSVPSGPSFSLPQPKDGSIPYLALSTVPNNTEVSVPAPPTLSEELVHKLIAQGQSAGDIDFRDLTNQIWLVFSSPDALNQSFQLDKGEESAVVEETGICVDLSAVRRTYQTLFALDSERIKNTMVNAMEMYRGYLQRQKAFKTKESLSHFVILMENPLLASPEFLKCFPKLLKAMVSLPITKKEQLIRWYSHYSTEDLLAIVRSLQQLVTLQLLFSEEEHPHHYIPQSDHSITAASGAMGLFFFANLLKAKQEGNMKPFSNSLNSFVTKTKAEFLQASDTDYEQLLLRFQVHPSLVKRFPIAIGEFINDELNGRVDMSIDYQRDYGNSIGEKTFSFLEHPYMLNITNKVEKLYRDNLVSMFSERHRAVIHSVLTGVADIPYLVLKVSRETIIEDALVQLETIADLNPIDLRKQLRVEFHGEEGVDEGGLQKEFFQLIIEKLFDPMYGLFLYDEATQQHWINPNSLESDSEYRLIGLLLGLAIYNNIILDIHFPMVIYRKLLGCPVDFSDLFSSHPVVANSLKSMLNFDDDPAKFQESFMVNFEVSSPDMFGNECKHELKENGKSVVVTMENRQEFVDLYTDWILAKSIHKKFKAFKQGFDLVMSQSCLADLVIAEELEIIICGSTEWDIDALEESTRYDGFTARQPVIVNFWEIVREFSESQRKKLLSFITGSDRIPVGGLSKLKLIIVKNGSDSDRLPTAHTCFNALLLCDYVSKEKLRERLVKAISNSKGFGMI